MDELASLGASLVGCQLCPLGKTRENNVVFGEGDATIPCMFIGEGPGEEEDRLGRPFVGRAGQLLSRILEAGSIPRDMVYITNVVKCRPPGNRVPSDLEMETCGQFLLKQVDLLKPRIIVAMGNIAKSFLLGKDTPGITRCRGNYYRWHDIQVVPMYHPSYLLRNASREVGGPKWQMWQDVRDLKTRLDALARGEELPTPAGGSQDRPMKQAPTAESKPDKPDTKADGVQLKLF